MAQILTPSLSEIVHDNETQLLNIGHSDQSLHSSPDQEKRKRTANEITDTNTTKIDWAALGDDRAALKRPRTTAIQAKPTAARDKALRKLSIAENLKSSKATLYRKSPAESRIPKNKNTKKIMRNFPVDELELTAERLRGPANHFDDAFGMGVASIAKSLNSC